MKLRHNLAGKRFGALVVSGHLRGVGWVVCCDCGTVKVIAAANLRTGRQQSCGFGCPIGSELRAAAASTHGESGTPEYIAWQSVLGRCLNPSNHKYHRYGGRGVLVCDRWRDSFEAFLQDMGRKPSAAHSIDRIDNDGNYEPGNCRWATPAEQANNKSTNLSVNVGGARMTLAEACQRFGMNYSAAQARIARGWPAETAVLEPVRAHKPYERRLLGNYDIKALED